MMYASTNRLRQGWVLPSGFAQAKKKAASHSEIRCITLVTRKLQEQLVCNSAYDLSSFLA